MSCFESFSRWAGGKTWLIPHLREIIGSIEIKHYHEPFLGGGAVFFNTTHHLKAYLSDTNKELINAYLCVRDHPEELIKCICNYENTLNEYYRIRNLITSDIIEAAAQFIFLNHTSYNGLYRVNRQGKYNVPYGYKKWVFNPQKIRSASILLHNTNICSCDFEENKYRIQKKDLVFLDPPYTVSHNNNGFIKYNKNLFSLSDQYRLSNYIDYLKRKGAYYILTNAAHQTVAEIFEKGDRRIELKRASLIGGAKAKRETVYEYIFTNIPEAKI